jgi:hemoglobin
MHAGNGELGDLGVRFVRCFLDALDDAEWPDDPEFRRALEAYIHWATDDVLVHSPDAALVPDDARLPHWTWEGLAS